MRTVIDTSILVSALLKCADVTDTKFLSLTIDGKASCIISGDDHLLTMNPFRSISILTAFEFLQRA